MLAEIAERYRQIDQLHAQALESSVGDSAATQELAIARSALGEGLMMRHLADPEHVSHEVIERIFARIFPNR